MVDPTTAELDRLEQKIEKLKREYDLFRTGQRKTEPTALRSELEKQVLRLTRFPFASTAMRFRMKTLAHRFQAVAAQARNLAELQARKQLAQTPQRPEDRAVLIDRAALDNPSALDSYLKRLHRAMAETATTADGQKPAPSFDALKRRLLAEARRQLERPEVSGVRFSVVEGEGGAKLRGEILEARTRSKDQ